MNDIKNDEGVRRKLVSGLYGFQEQCDILCKGTMVLVFARREI
jgi:hypothetical protein